MDAICRICLFSESEFGNTHLITPCDCSGSMKYVHLECILRWQQITENTENLTSCELCTADYTLPTKWPLENKPVPGGDGRWFLLQRSYVWIIISYYVHFMFITIYQKYFGPTIVIQSNINYGPEINAIIDTEQQVNNYNHIYALICGCITFIYALEYYKHVYYIQNKSIYLKYWFLGLENNDMVWQPYKLLALSTVSFIFLPVNLWYGVPYLYSLPQYYDTHCAIVNQMNHDAQFI